MPDVHEAIRAEGLNPGARLARIAGDEGRSLAIQETHMANLTSIVQTMYADFMRGDVGAIVARFADDIRFIHNGAPEVPYAKHRTGRAEATAFFSELAANVDVTLFEVTRYVEQGDTVVAVGRFGGRAIPTGKAFTEDWAMLWVFEGEKVKLYQAYDDTSAAAKAFAK
jgi:hypothetical protein